MLIRACAPPPSAPTVRWEPNVTPTCVPSDVPFVMFKTPSSLGSGARYMVGFFPAASYVLSAFTAQRT